MIVAIDTASVVPPWLQLAEQIGDQIVGGVLAIGHRLPAIRQLARDLELAPGTVARAYRELEGAGIIETRGRHGSFVLRAPEPRHDRAQAVIEQAAAHLQRLGVSLEDATKILAEQWHAPEPT